MKVTKVIVCITILLFLFLRLLRLNFLPIFADEAIYLRWASMIYHDPQQFLFLPMYDGKTPLFIWLLIPVTRIFRNDPLLGGRLLATIFGGLTAWLIVKITKQTGGDKTAQIISGLLYIILPFSFFFDRMSLIDVPLTFMLATAYYFGLRWTKTKTYSLALMTGLFFGLAVLTKTSALYALPIFMWLGLKKISRKDWPQLLVGGGLAGLMVMILRMSPLFPFLFNRSSDFAFSISEIISQPIQILTLNLPRVSSWLWTYMTPGFWMILIGGGGYSLIRKKMNEPVVELILTGLFFVFPFLISGKLLTSRYLLPSVIWFIPAASLVITMVAKTNKYFAGLMTIVIMGESMRFIWPMYTDLNQTRLTPDDKHQYLSDWSAGFGIPQIRDYLKSKIDAGKTVLVATEGYFGTLPDGLFIYFSETDRLQHMEIFGVGQPIVATPPALLEKSEYYDEAYLVVNQNRIDYKYDQDFELISSYKKPNNGPALLLLRLKQ